MCLRSRHAPELALSTAPTGETKTDPVTVDLDTNDFRMVQIRLDDGRWAAGSLEAYR